MRELIETVYYWPDGQVGAFGIEGGLPHRRVCCTRGDHGRPVETILPQLIECVSSSARFVKMRRDEDGRLWRLETSQDEFFTWCRNMFLREYLQARQL